MNHFGKQSFRVSVSAKSRPLTTEFWLGLEDGSNSNSHVYSAIRSIGGLIRDQVGFKCSNKG